MGLALPIPAHSAKTTPVGLPGLHLFPFPDARRRRANESGARPREPPSFRIVIAWLGRNTRRREWKRGDQRDNAREYGRVGGFYPGKEVCTEEYLFCPSSTLIRHFHNSILLAKTPTRQRHGPITSAVPCTTLVCGICRRLWVGQERSHASFEPRASLLPGEPRTRVVVLPSALQLPTRVPSSHGAMSRACDRCRARRPGPYAGPSCKRDCEVPYLIDGVLSRRDRRARSPHPRGNLVKDRQLLLPATRVIFTTDLRRPPSCPDPKISRGATRSGAHDCPSSFSRSLGVGRAELATIRFSGESGWAAGSHVYARWSWGKESSKGAGITGARTTVGRRNGGRGIFYLAVFYGDSSLADI